MRVRVVIRDWWCPQSRLWTGGTTGNCLGARCLELRPILGLSATYRPLLRNKQWNRDARALDRLRRLRVRPHSSMSWEFRLPCSPFRTSRVQAQQRLQLSLQSAEWQLMTQIAEPISEPNSCTAMLIVPHHFRRSSLHRSPFPALPTRRAASGG